MKTAEAVKPCSPPRAFAWTRAIAFEEVRAVAAASGFVAHIRSRGEGTQAPAQPPGQKARRRAVERTHSWMNRWCG